MSGSGHRRVKSGSGFSQRLGKMQVCFFLYLICLFSLVNFCCSVFCFVRCRAGGAR